MWLKCSKKEEKRKERNPGFNAAAAGICRYLYNETDVLRSENWVGAGMPLECRTWKTHVWQAYRQSATWQRDKCFSEEKLP